MRVFVLCSGRSGSVTFARACKQIQNYTAAHESAAGRVGADRLLFSDQHIEVDNHLIWFIGELDKRYGDEPFYVHLTRNPESVAASYLERWDRLGRESAIRGFAYGILQRSSRWPENQRTAVCRYFVDTITANIEFFLSRKPQAMTVRLESIHDDFPEFWKRIGAAGDLDRAMQEWTVRNNPNPRRGPIKRIVRSLAGRIL
jgi:hypothetical protein